MNSTPAFPFRNPSLPLEERVSDLVSRLTLEEKINNMPQYQSAIERLGIQPYKHGTESAHGIAWLGEATSFPQPIGLGCTWDQELMKEIGDVIGTEARVFYKRNPQINGLTLWAPTVDMERDPRWGRTEEAYGEDPHLTGELSAALVQGIQGDHPKYLKAVATLKHFLGNNNEINRGSCSASIDPRNMREYYFKAFEPAFIKSRAQSMMTAYNSVNGTPVLLHETVNSVVKEQWMDGFIVSDAGDMIGIVNDHHYYDSFAQAVAHSIKAGIDSITDEAKAVTDAIREALAQGLLSEPDLDKALSNTFRVRMRLGEFDPQELVPYAAIDDSSLMKPEHQALSLKAAQKNIVLLKNNGALPLDASKLNNVAVIGPLGDTVYRDWYSGTFPYKVTPLQAIQQKLAGKPVAFADGNDRIKLRSKASGRYLAIAEGESGQLAAVADAAGAETFQVGDWGWGSLTLQAESNGKFVTTDETQVTASATEAFGWFVKEVFHLEPQEGGAVAMATWNNKTVTALADQPLVVNEEPKANGDTETFDKEVVHDGLQAAIEAARQSEVAIVFVGNNPLVNGKEETDRPGMELAEAQERLVKAVYEANPNTIVVVTGGYPFTLNWIEANIPAVIYSSHSGQEHGTALADVLFGDYNPAGRLNMTWYRSAEQLSDLMDYDIMKSKRTYLYFEDKPLYPFGHGLSYASFAYGEPQLGAAEIGAEDELAVSVRVQNTSEVAGEEVVQLYVKCGKSRVKRPLKKLYGFRRIMLQPGEARTVTFLVPAAELALWDVTRDQYAVEAGEYTVMIGSTSDDIRARVAMRIHGETIPPRSLRAQVKAENYDDYEGAFLGESKEGYACVELSGVSGWIAFHDTELGAGAQSFQARVASVERGGRIEVRLGSAEGTVVGSAEVPATGGAQAWTTVTAALQGAVGRQDVYIVLAGDVRLSWVQLA
ncbi:glycoside hydrolase family 3 protein [Paenibacillus sp. MMS18-CY102]|uniref:glycoside hydrolase family 3 protein n=1 Tax=Paenibacillus sp. MMS18-CY102 TaxID=2682849 RepID=UPI0013653AE8|nr:glycoside hydrolase family 3 protein [Paenibacillus sp. MMS18-CY102]MWC27829.1 carbohydrate-binding protein [Paenibacillus sp. MMS18-CY102]